MTNMRRLAVAYALAASFWDCRSEEPGRASAIDTAKATEAQSDRPRLAPGSATLIERLRLAHGGRWSDARDVAADAEGNLYVLDATVPSRILKFDPAGRYLLRFGEDDPDSALTQARRISLAPEWNTIVVADRLESAVAAFLTLGMRTYSVLTTGGVPIAALGMPRFGEYYLHGWDQARSRSGVYHMRLPLDTLATTYEVVIPVDEPIQRVARAVYFRTAVDRQGRLYVGFNDGYPVRVLEPSGRSVRVIGIDRDPVLRSPEEIESETVKNLAKLREQAPDIPDSLLLEAARPDTILSMIEELAVDPMGRLWVRTNREDVAGSTYDVFDEHGQYLARVDVPGNVRATTFAPDGRLFVIDESGDSAGVVVGYEVGF